MCALYFHYYVMSLVLLMFALLLYILSNELLLWYMRLILIYCVHVVDLACMNLF
jgi:hypothetical protein